MSMVEDIRQVFQDFLAPELRAITARLDGIDKRFEPVEKVAAARHAELLTPFELVESQNHALDEKSQARDAELKRSIEALHESFDISRRLDRLEARRKAVSAEKPRGKAPSTEVPLT